MGATRKKTKAPRLKDEEPVKTSGLRPDEMPADVLEFLTAIERYKRTHQRPFPSWSEVFEVVKDLGYVRPASPLRPERRRSA